MHHRARLATRFSGQCETRRCKLSPPSVEAAHAGLKEVTSDVVQSVFEVGFSVVTGPPAAVA
jgi:hypothetical protein